MAIHYILKWNNWSIKNTLITSLIFYHSIPIKAVQVIVSVWPSHCFPSSFSFHVPERTHPVLSSISSHWHKQKHSHFLIYEHLIPSNSTAWKLPYCTFFTEHLVHLLILTCLKRRDRVQEKSYTSFKSTV